jgi:nitric oxide reductase subunit B
MIAGNEPRHQHWLSHGLLGALAIVVFGSLAGEFAGIQAGFKKDGRGLATKALNISTWADSGKSC